MGGAQRNQRNRNSKQSAQAARAIASARGANAQRNKLIAGIVIVVVFAAAIIGAVLLSNSKTEAKANDVIPVVEVNQSYPVKVNDGVVVAGKDSAKNKVTLYEDFLCPACGIFNKLNADDIETALEKGQIQVSYHFLPFLDRNSNPNGYSGRAAGAALSVAKNSPTKFATFTASLYKKQPQEGGPGYTNGQLISLGKRAGVGGTFEQDVNGEKNEATVQALMKKSQDAMVKASEDGKSLATPTIIANGNPVKKENWATRGPGGGAAKGDWLTKLVGDQS